MVLAMLALKEQLKSQGKLFMIKLETIQNKACRFWGRPFQYFLCQSL